MPDYLIRLELIQQRLGVEPTQKSDEAIIHHKSSHETAPLTRLTAEEKALYGQLGRDELGHQIRLEQEKIGFEWLVDALKKHFKPDWRKSESVEVITSSKSGIF